MRLYSGKINALSEELVHALVEGKDIECESKPEVARDLESVFANYLEMDRQATEKAKDALQARGMPQSEFPRLRKLAAEQKGIKVGDEMFDFLLDQVIEMLMHSNNVEEVYASDNVLRSKIHVIMKKHLDVDDEIDKEARSRLKHLQEGTSAFDIEYNKTVEQIRRARGLI